MKDWKNDIEDSNKGENHDRHHGHDRLKHHRHGGMVILLFVAMVGFLGVCYYRRRKKMKMKRR